MKNLKDYPIHIQFGHHSSDLPDAEQWCKDMELDYYNGMPNPMYFGFKDENSAMLFKLTWG